MNLIEHAKENGIVKGAKIQSILFKDSIQVEILEDPYVADVYGAKILVCKARGLSYMYKVGEELDEFNLSDNQGKLTVKKLEI